MRDVLLGQRGVIVLPAIAREGLAVCVGDVVDVVHDEEREELLVIGLEPDRDPSLVRLRLEGGVPIAPGFEVWPSQTQSHVVFKRPTAAMDGRVVALSGATTRRRA